MKFELSQIFPDGTRRSYEKVNGKTKTILKKVLPEAIEE